MENDPSIVEYFSEHEGHRCGYCKSTDTNLSHGMWAHQMHVQDYQDLIDRGWRRSGKYCYKPTMNRTCCPMYTIKCDALEFKLSKSQKKAIKRVNRFLITGNRESGEDAADNPIATDDGMNGEGDVKSLESLMAEKIKPSSVDLPLSEKGKNSEVRSLSKDSKQSPVHQECKNVTTASSSNQQTATKKRTPKQGSGPDPSKPVCRKAKELRAEKRQQKLASDPKKVRKQSSAQRNAAKSLEELLGEPDTAPHCAHKLEIELCRSSPKSKRFLSTFKDSHSVFSSYQMAVHEDQPHECNESSFEGFLVDSPLKELHKDSGPSMGYGSFHQHYLLDGQIIAVGVIDILPSCVSSVYLYYDPAFSFLTLGIYSALREIAFVRELARETPNLRNYYMGFYIHSCVKMRYKGGYFPSYLKCPETYNWVPIEKCRPKLDQNKYSRLAEEGKEDQDKIENINQVLVLHKRTAMPYAVFSAMKKGKNSDQDEVKEYATFTGRTCAERMLLVRK